MSILNIVLTGKTRADVYVDTMSRDLNSGAFTPMTKLFALPHLNCVIGGRGLAHTMMYIAAAATMAGSLDVVLAGITGAITLAEAARREVAGGATPAVLAEEAAGTTIAVVGWSGDRVFAKLWNGWKSRDPAHAIIDLDQTRSRAYFSPDVEVEGFPAMMNDAQMIALARRQVALARELHPDAPIGGHLIAASVTERGTTMRTLAEVEASEPASESGVASCDSTFLPRCADAPSRAQGVGAAVMVG